mgnify:CR=1 FL=1
MTTVDELNNLQQEHTLDNEIATKYGKYRKYKVNEYDLIKYVDVDRLIGPFERCDLCHGFEFQHLERINRKFFTTAACGHNYECPDKNSINFLSYCHYCNSVISGNITKRHNGLTRCKKTVICGNAHN